MTDIRYLLWSLALGVVSTTATAQTTWVGTTSSWGTPSNWSTGVVPTSADDVVIGAAAAVPNTAGTTAECRNLTVTASGAVVIDALSPLSVHGNATASGSVTGGVVELLAPGTCSGTFPSLDVGSDYTVGTTTTVTGNLRQLGGTLTTGTLTVAGTASFLGTTVTNGGGTLTLSGDVTFATTSAVTFPAVQIDFAGSTWTSNANFDPTQGIVAFVGSGAQTANAGSFTWARLEIGPSAQVTAIGNVHTRSTLRVEGTLTVAPGATDIQVDNRLEFGFGSSRLEGSTITALRILNGISGIGTIELPAATLDVDGTCSFSAPATLNVATAPSTAPHTFSGTLNAPSSVTFTSSDPSSTHYRFDGTGTVAGVLPNVEIAGNYVSSVTTNFDYLQSSGTLTVGNTTVNGNATFQGTTLTSGGGTLTLNGDVDFATTGAITNPAIRIDFVGSTWTSNANFDPMQGIVAFVGSGIQTANVASFTWARLEIGPSAQVTAIGDVRTRSTLRIEGTLTVAPGATDVQVDDRLEVALGSSRLEGSTVTRLRILNGINASGTIELPAATLDVDGDASFGPSAGLTVGVAAASAPHTFSNDFTAFLSMPIISADPSATHFRFDGAGFPAQVVFGTFPNVEVTGVCQLGNNMVVDFDFTQTGGTLLVSNARVRGTSTFQGATITNLGGILTLDGDADFATTAAVTHPANRIDFSGSTWTSNANFVPTSTPIRFLGTGPQSVNAVALTLPSLEVGSSSQLSIVTAQLTLGTDLTVDGAFTAPAGSLDVGQDLVVRPGGTVDVGAVEFTGPTPANNPVPLPPPTFVVNSALDGAPAVDGNLTLREAVLAATTNTAVGDAQAGTAGLDVIVFDPALFAAICDSNGLAFRLSIRLSTKRYTSSRSTTTTSPTARMIASPTPPMR